MAFMDKLGDLAKNIGEKTRNFPGRQDSAARVFMSDLPD